MIGACFGRSLKDTKTQNEIAIMFGVSAPTVRAILAGKMYAGKSKIRHYTAEEDAKIREAISLGYNMPQIAAHVGRPLSAITGRVYRLGLKSGQPLSRS